MLPVNKNLSVVLCGTAGFEIVKSKSKHMHFCYRCFAFFVFSISVIVVHFNIEVTYICVLGYVFVIVTCK